MATRRTAEVVPYHKGSVPNYLSYILLHGPQL